MQGNKNNTVLKYLAWLVGRGMFILTAMLNHEKGHTHNILDQLYGVIARCFKFVDTLEDIYAIAREIQAILMRPSLLPWFHGAEVIVVVLEGVRRWDAWLARSGVHIEGGLQFDATGMHCWLFMLRKQLPYALRPVPALVKCDLHIYPFANL